MGRGAWERGWLSTTPTQLAIKCFKLSFSYRAKKYNIVSIIKQNQTKHVYFPFFNPLMVRANSKQKVYNEFRGANSVGAKQIPLTENMHCTPATRECISEAGLY